MRKLYGYVLAHDHGFAPNPFYGSCTLATCKPRIRKNAQEGDWVIGTSSARYADDSLDLVYAMKVTEEPLSLEEYNSDPRFEAKKSTDEDWRSQRGDNIYYREGDNWSQRENPFHDEDHMEHDLGGKRVLVSTHFVYFGQEQIRLPEGLQGLAHASREGRGWPGHSIESDSKKVATFIDWLGGKLDEQGLDWGRSGDPHDSDFKEDWRESRRDHSCGKDA